MRHALRRSQGTRHILSFAAMLAAVSTILSIGVGTTHAQTVTVTSSAGTGGTITPSGTITLPVGSNLTLTVTPDTGFHVSKLVVDGKSAAAAPSYTFENLTKNHKIAAKFKKNVYTVTTSASGGFKIKPSGTLSYPFGKVKTFKILPPSAGVAPYLTLDGVPVTPAPSGSIWIYTLTVAHDHALAVSAPPSEVMVTVLKAGSGQGVVTGPGGIDCGAVCQASLAPGTEVALTALAEAGSVFVEWSGACAGVSPACLFTANAPATATARFDLETGEEEAFQAIPEADPPSGKAPLAVSLVPDGDGAADPIAFYAWDDDGDGTWDSCDPDDPGNPSAPCDTQGVPRDHLYGAIGQYAPALLVQTTTGDRAIASTLVVASGTTSEEKILAALDAGSIDTETALTYRIYADFGDSRLPAEYAGDDPGPAAECGAIMELAAGFDTLSPATQALLAPFLMPPIYTGSWYSLRMAAADSGTAITAPATAALSRPVCTSIDTGWKFEPSGSAVTHVRVWWDDAHSPVLAAKASHVASEINAVIWPKLANPPFSMREPLADDVPGANGCFGEDGLLDIYLSLTPGGRSGTVPVGNCNVGVPAYIEARSNIEDGTVAHELFHAFEFSYTLGTCHARDPYRWWTEASAEWARDFVYPTPKGNRGLEQSSAPDYLETTRLSLDNRTNPDRAYGAYVFPFYLSHEHQAEWIRQSWQLMELDVEPPIEALDQVMTGGFEARWPKFAARAWNRRPYHEFWKWDRLGARAKSQAVTEVQMQGQQTTEYTMPVALPRVSVVYHRYKFADDAARTVTFVNGLTWKATKGPLPNGLGIYGDGYAMTSLSPADKKGGSVQVLLKIDGTWRVPVDLTDVPHITWCRDSRAERIEEAVFILANSDTDENRILSETDQPSSLFVTNIGCHEWDGAVDFVFPEDGSVKTELHMYDLKYTIFGAPIASPLATASGPFNPFVRPFRLTDGSLTLTVSGTDTGGCTYDGSITALFLPDGRTDTPQYLNLFTGLYAGVAYHSLQIAIARIPQETYNVTVCCPDPESGVVCSPQQRSFSTILFYDPLISSGNPLQPSGDRIQGTSEEMIGFPPGTGSWSFDAVREP